jgi:NAD(P)H dehydrogenase (quinone)
VEEKLERSGLGWTHLRPNAFMQTLLGYLPTLVSYGGVLRLPAGEGRVGWVDARDIAAVAFRALTEDGHDGRAYAVTGPEALSMANATAAISDATLRNVRYEDTAPETAREALLAAGLPIPFADFLVGFYAAVRAGAHDAVTGDVAEVTGRAPRSFGDYTGEHADAFAGGR